MDFPASCQNHAAQDRAVLSSTGDERSSRVAPQSTGSLSTSPFMCWISQGISTFSVSVYFGVPIIIPEG